MKKNYLLITFILSKAIFLIDTLLISYYPEVVKISPNLIGIGLSFQFILGPALFFVIIETTRQNLVFKPIHLLHLVPFILSLLIMIFSYHIYSYNTKIALLQHGFPWSAPWSRAVSTINYIQFVTYGICSLVVLSRAQKELNKVTSQFVGKNIFYLKFLIYDFSIVWGLNIVSPYFPVPGLWWEILGPLTVLNIFFVANAVVYSGLKFPQIFLNGEITRQKYEKNPLTDSEREYYTSKVQNYMEEQKPYLNPDLSLADLSARLAIPSHILSQVLNVSLKQNFYDFVNSYRIEESKRLLTTPDNGKTILEVLYQSGFNSKSVFNNSFKKVTGITPTEFKRNSLIETPQVAE